MSDDSVRRSLHESLQATSSDESGLPQNSFLVGWVTIAEWVDLDGQRWLSRIGAGADGGRIPEWQLMGYLHNALFCSEDFEEVEDD